jgi:hypothetical protein
MSVDDHPPLIDDVHFARVFIEIEELQRHLNDVVFWLFVGRDVDPDIAVAIDNDRVFRACARTRNALGRPTFCPRADQVARRC